VIGAPVGEPSFAEKHELWGEEETLGSREDHGRLYRVLDTCHDDGRGNPEFLHRFCERRPVVEGRCGHALVGEEPACEQDAIPRESAGALGHAVLLLETLDCFLLGTPGDEVLYESGHAQEWMLCDAPREVPVA
jgi:hypothetical protein